MRVGVIGLGSIGKRHAANAREMGHVVCFYDPMVDNQPPHMIRATEIGVIADFSEAVLICTPAVTHADVAAQLRIEGYRSALFVEKPLALSVEECAIFREWPSPVTMTGYQLRFHPVARALKQIGGWVHGMFGCRCNNSKYGNDLFELSHEIDLALWLGVEPNPGYLDGQAQDYSRSWYADQAGLALGVQFSTPEALGTEMYHAELAHFLDCVEKNVPTITPFSDGIRVVQICEDAMAGARA